MKDMVQMSGGRTSLVILGVVTASLLGEAYEAVQGDPLPVIVSYEMSKAKTDARALARDPKGFWVSEIVTRIEDRKTAHRRSLKHPMSVAVDFVVDRSGRVVSRAVARSSGDPMVDNEALEVLDRAAPFPPMPAAVPEDHLAFTMPLRFR